MKILLIQAPIGRMEPLIYPLGLAYLAGALRDHSVRAIDPNVPGVDTEAVIETIREFRPDMVGISLRNIDSQMLRDLHYYLPSFVELLHRIRPELGSAPIVVGGAGFSLFPDKIMARNPEIDIGVRLEGEEVLAALAAGRPPSTLPAVYYREQGRVISNPPGGFAGFDRLPEPDWSILDVSPYVAVRGAIGIQTKRGCSLRCAYCTYPMLNGSRIRRREPEAVVAEIERLVRDHGLRHFTFVDAIFNIPEDHAWAIMDLMGRRNLGVRWSAWFNERPLTEEFVRAAMRVGCDEFSFSPDAYSDRALEALQKNIRVEDIRKVLGFLERIPGMRASFNFFINPPGNDLATTWRLVKLFFKCKTRWRDRVTGFVLASPRVEPETAIYDRALREGVVDPAADLLPEDESGLRRLFYANPGTGAVEFGFRLYIALWKLKQRLTPGGARP